MKKVLAVLAIVAAAFVPTPSKADTLPGPGYATVMFGRTNWEPVTSNCTPPPGAVTLEQTAQDLATRGLFGVGGVVVNRTAEHDQTCFQHYTLQPSWDDLARLRDTYNWKFISQGETYTPLTTMTSDQQRYDESCATLPVFYDHGHNNAWGAFAYPNNKVNTAARNVVNHCFAFGRLYGNTLNTRAKATTSPYNMITMSVNGGSCNNPTLACYNVPTANGRRTMPPAAVSALLSPGPDQWGVVQYYRIVTGSYGVLGNNLAWDCTSPNWQDRWTSKPELTCQNNFDLAMDGRSLTAVPADPATVATAWGRNPS